MSILVFYGAALAQYGFGADHPFGPDRLAAFWQETIRRGLDKRVQIGEPAMCTEQELLAFHTAAYVERVKHQSRLGEGYLDYGDTPAFKGVYEAARFVVGSSLAALTAVMTGKAARAFQPIGGLHHATRGAAAGFCVFNDIGVLIEIARARFGLTRIAYIDIDAHHGDGVYYGFESDPNVFIADTHEDGRFLYPGTGHADETGTGLAHGTKLNIPLPPGANDEAFQEVWPRIEEFVCAARPELILLQAGADSIAGDPITHLQLSPKSHAHAARRLCAVSDEHCSGRLVGFGGGGYDRTNLAAAWNEVIAAMLADE